MPGKTIGIKMNVGYPGTQSRSADAIVQARVANTNIKFGEAVILTEDNKWASVTSSSVGTDIAGVAVREVVQCNTFDPQSNPDFMQGAIADVMVRGNCTVKCQRGTPKAGAAVYVRIKENSSYASAVVGGFEAADDTGNVVQVSNIEWTTGVTDSDGNTEITIKTRAHG